MATVLKLSIFDFCDFWIATPDLETCMHGSNFFYPTRPGPVRLLTVDASLERPILSGQSHIRAQMNNINMHNPIERL